MLREFINVCIYRYQDRTMKLLDISVKRINLTLSISLSFKSDNLFKFNTINNDKTWQKYSLITKGITDDKRPSKTETLFFYGCVVRLEHLLSSWALTLRMDVLQLHKVYRQYSVPLQLDSAEVHVLHENEGSRDPSQMDNLSGKQVPIFRFVLIEIIIDHRCH